MPRDERATSAVIYRKLSLGTQSRQGERRIERLLAAHTTCRLQHRSLFSYLTDVLTANAHGHPAHYSPEQSPTERLRKPVDSQALSKR
jgi:hypothetical protein